MKTHWLHQNNKETLIIFFAGWGQDEHVFKHLNSLDYDVLIIYDYTVLNKLKIEDRYNSTIIISWSLGVWISEHTNSEIIKNSQLSIAINGTTNPIDNQYGIPPQIYQGTVDGFTERNRDKFIMRMCGNKEALRSYNKPYRSLESQLEELIAIQEAYLTTPRMNSSNYQHILISEDDRIFPAKNQKDGWNSLSSNHKIILETSPHYPFYLWKSWDEIIAKFTK